MIIKKTSCIEVLNHSGTSPHSIKMRFRMFVSVQEKDHVPEDRGPVQDLRELERLDKIHDAGDDPQRDCHVSENHGLFLLVLKGKHTPIKSPLVCSRAMMMTACDLSAIAKPWEIQSKVDMFLGVDLILVDNH